MSHFFKKIAFKTGAQQFIKTTMKWRTKKNMGKNMMLFMAFYQISDTFVL